MARLSGSDMFRKIRLSLRLMRPQHLRHRLLHFRKRIRRKPRSEKARILVSRRNVKNTNLSSGPETHRSKKYSRSVHDHTLLHSWYKVCLAKTSSIVMPNKVSEHQSWIPASVIFCDQLWHESTLYGQYTLSLHSIASSIMDSAACYTEHPPLWNR